MIETNVPRAGRNPTEGVEVAVDGDRVLFTRRGRLLDPALGMARLFGNFDLVGSLPSVRARGQKVLLYRPPSRRSREHLDAFPRHVWLETQPGLWMAHDGEHLLLVPTDPLLAKNLTRDI
jgi:hypothetical protein